MKRLIFTAARLLVFLLIPFSVQSQNLIQNPGFELDKNNWSGFWSNEGSGSATVVSSPVNSGNKAVKIDYPGAKDWSFSSTQIAVNPGETYEMSCYTLISTLVSEANFSIILYDAKQNVINWVYSRIRMDKKTSTYTKLSGSFVVPEGIKYIQPRFEGWGSCTLYADDVSLIKSENTGISGDYMVENDQIKAIVQLPFLSINLTNKVSAKNYQTGWAQFAIVKSVDRINNQSIKVLGELLNEAKSAISIEFTLEGKALKMKISGDSAAILSSGIQYPGIIASKTNDYLIIPRGTGIMVPVNNNNPFGNFATYSWKSTMPFVGVTNLKDGYMLATDDQWDAEFMFEKPSGQSLYSFKLQNGSAKGVLGYNRTDYLVLVDNGYVEMCSWYRDHAEKMGYVKTFEQKKAENPNIDKLIGAVDFWPLMMDLKPSFLDSVKLMGIDKAIWNLIGNWGTYNFSTLIDSINSKGFLSGRYDIFTDVWPPSHPEWIWYRSEGYPVDVLVNSAGELKKGWLAYPNNQPFQGYYTCSQTHLAYAKKYVPRDLATNRYNCRFVDVELAASLEECCSTVHPATRKQDAKARNSLISYIKNDLNLITGVEEAHDFAFSNVDYGEGTMTIVPAVNSGYDWLQPLDPTDSIYAKQNISTALRIPLHGLVYHDVHIPTWYTGDGASKVPAFWDDKDLWNILYGTMPLYMPPSVSYWKTNLEKFISGYHLISTVTRNVGYSKMIDHQFVSSDRNVQKTTFENGWNVVANFDINPHDWNNMTLAPKGFYASGGKGDEAGKLIVNKQNIAWAITANRLFLNPYGNECTMKGLRTSQSVFVEKFRDYLLVSFIGKQAYLDLNLTELPFEILAITKVTEYFTGNAIALTTTSDGWKRLTRSAGKTFFKLYFTPKTTGFIQKSKNSGISVFPNPANNQLNIVRPESSGEGRISICNLNGEELIRQVISESKTAVDISSLCSGMYVLNFIQDNKSNMLKFVKH